MKLAIKYPEKRNQKMKLKRLFDRNNVSLEKVTLICDIEPDLLPEIRATGARIINLNPKEMNETARDNIDVGNCIGRAALQAVQEYKAVKNQYFLLDDFTDDTILGAIKHDIDWITQEMKEMVTNSGNFLIPLIKNHICHRLQVLVNEFRNRTGPDGDKLLEETFPSK